MIGLMESQWGCGSWCWTSGVYVITAMAELQRHESEGVGELVAAMLKIPGPCQSMCTCCN